MMRSFMSCTPGIVVSRRIIKSYWENLHDEELHVLHSRHCGVR
jgi:hypothetical protein